MAAFVMLGRYTPEAVGRISAERTGKAVDLVKKLGGKMGAMYALLGAYDLAFVVELPGTPEAMKASVALGKATGIAFTTLPAVPVEEFDKLVGGK